MELDDLMGEIREETRKRDHVDTTEARETADRVMNAHLTDKEYAALQARRAEYARLREMGMQAGE